MKIDLVSILIVGLMIALASRYFRLRRIATAVSNELAPFVSLVALEPEVQQGELVNSGSHAHWIWCDTENTRRIDFEWDPREAQISMLLEKGPEDLQKPRDKIDVKIVYGPENHPLVKGEVWMWMVDIRSGHGRYIRSPLSGEYAAEVLNIVGAISHHWSQKPGSQRSVLKAAQ